MIRLFVLVLAGKVSADVTWCFNLVTDGPSELLYTVFVELFFREVKYIYIYI